MSKRSQGISRRDLLAGVAGSAAIAALGPRLASGARAAKARVVRVESPKVWRGKQRDPQVVAAMVERGLLAFSGATSAAAAWRGVVQPEQRVGLKINVLGRPFIYTAPEITAAVARAVIAVGVEPARVVVWDRHQDHFSGTRYKLGTGAQGERIAAGGRFDAAVRFKGSVGEAALDSMITKATDVTINLPVLKDHRTAGVTLALKNIAFGCYDHYDAAHEHDCEPFISEAYRHFAARAKVPLIIMDATAACFDGGPRPPDRGRLWREGAIYVASDPVALDVVCRKAIMAQRKTRGLADKTRQARHIEAAAKLGLGVADPARIELVTVKV